MNRCSDDGFSLSEDRCEITCVHPDKVRSALDSLPVAEDLRQQAECFRLLGEPTRLRLLYALAAEELCVCDLSALLDASPSAVSHQLRLLRTAGLVRYRKDGKMVYYTLEHPVLRELLAGPNGLFGERVPEDE